MEATTTRDTTTASSEATAAEARPIPENLQRAKAFIEREFRTSPQITEIARAAHKSPWYFHRLFHAAYGETPKAMVTRLRLAEARRLLAETDTPLPDVAAALGWSTHSHFCCAFHRATGTPPGRWRREHRKPAGAAAA
jgi:AraC-like DNA-binding protein